MLIMTVNDPLFKWFLLAGILTFTLSIVLEVRMRRQQKQKARLNGDLKRHQDQSDRP